MPAFLTIYYAYTTDYQNQGRYLLPALLPLMYYMIKGIQKLSELKIKGRTFPRWLVNTGVSESLFKVGLCLPSGPYVTDEDVAYIVDCIKKNICYN